MEDLGGLKDLVLWQYKERHCSEYYTVQQEPTNPQREKYIREKFTKTGNESNLILINYVAIIHVS